MTRTSDVARLACVLAVAIGALGACSSGGGGGGPADVEAPATSVSRPGGTYAIALALTLTATEPATIYYTLDGSDPSVAGGNTLSGESPVGGISVGEGTTVLKFFAVDAAGNQGVMRTETYTVDLSAPVVSLAAGAPAEIGWLDDAQIQWQADESGAYVIEVGGTGAPGTGTQVESGTVSSLATRFHEVPGTTLDFDQPTTCWIHVTDAVGNVGSLSVDVVLKPLERFALPGRPGDLVIDPAGDRLYVANMTDEEIVVMDIDPSSTDFHTVVATVDLGIRPRSLKITPDGKRLYVSNSESPGRIAVITTADHQLEATLSSATTPGLDVPAGVSVTPDGTRGYFTNWDGTMRILDTDDTSGSFHKIIGSVFIHGLLLWGEIAITPDGKLAVLNWAGGMAQAIDVINVDPTSPFFNIPVGSPGPIVSGGSGGVVTTSDSAIAYATSTASTCGLCKIDLSTNSIVANESGLGAEQTPALTPDDAYLISIGVNTTQIRLVDANDLALLGTIEVGRGVRSVGVTPDGIRAYATRGDSVNELIVVPLR
ncbi:MAG: YncE family protein [Planctomycetota bacterium]|jgi:DNA-binding beta-propeller fold protein YncE